MKVINHLPEVAYQGETAVTIGNFDGVHVGHQRLLEAMVASARQRNLVPTVVTFHPHPQRVLHPERSFFYISPLEDRLSRLEALGVEFAVSILFSPEIAQLSADEFVKRLVGHLHMRELWVGPDFALGRGRQGDVPYLRQLGERMGYRLFAVPPVVLDGEEVHSSTIRQRLSQDGNIRQVSQMLGYDYFVDGVVMPGDGRGRQMGVPTANLSLPEYKLLPANGVYATWAKVDGTWWPGVTNVGVRPTVGPQGNRRIETHLLGFDGDLYGHKLRLTFIQRLRSEQHFADLAALGAQIQVDAEAGAEALARYPFAPAAQPWFKELPHTADLAVRASGKTITDLFRQAAAAMYSFMAQRPLGDRCVRHVTLTTAPDLAGQLVAWLNELLYLSEEYGELYDTFIVFVARADRVEAIVGGWAVGRFIGKIKAATYHSLAVERIDDSWRATLIFDV